MKKMRKLLCIGMALVMMLALASCNGGGGNSGGLTEVGTWELTDINMRTIEQGKLAAANHNTITLFSDNTFVLTSVVNTLYSSDGGETYNPTSYVNDIVHGKYEVTEKNEELNETTIKITEITRVTHEGYDSDTDASDADKDALKNN